MAHELSIRANGKAEMAFIGGETPWHGLGQSVTKGASIGVWMREAGMDWDALEAPVQFQYEHRAASDRPGDPARRATAALDTHKVIYRGDTNAPLGVVGTKYNVVQPKQVLEFFRDMTEQQGWYIHTAGVLRGGRKLWAMASNGQVEALSKKGDKIINQLMLATSLDGSMKTVVKECATVVVCANTLAIALRENGKGVVVSHRSVFDERAVKKSLGLAQGEFDHFMKQARIMAEKTVKLDEALEVLEKVFGSVRTAQPAAKKVDTSWMGELKDIGNDTAVEDDEDDAKVARSTSRVLELFAGAGIGASQQGRVGTRWGLFNAVTQYIDHEAGRTPDTRIESAWFGRGDTIKQNALEALVA